MKTLTLNTESLMTVILSLSEAKAVIKEALEESIDALNHAKQKYILNCVENADSNYNFNELIKKNDSFFMNLTENVEDFCETNNYENMQEGAVENMDEFLSDLAIQLSENYKNMYSNLVLANELERGEASLEDRNLTLKHGAQRIALEQNPIKGYFFN